MREAGTAAAGRRTHSAAQHAPHSSLVQAAAGQRAQAAPTFGAWRWRGRERRCAGRRTAPTPAARAPWWRRAVRPSRRSAGEWVGVDLWWWGWEEKGGLDPDAWSRQEPACVRAAAAARQKGSVVGPGCAATTYCLQAGQQAAYNCPLGTAAAPLSPFPLPPPSAPLPGLLPRRRRPAVPWPPQSGQAAGRRRRPGQGARHPACLRVY
jgi:hypothetical protein